MHRIPRAAILAVVLALVGAAPVAADQTVPDTVTVPASVSIQGLPASIDYGTALPGEISPQKNFSLTLTANVNGWTVTLNGSALTRSGGTETLASGMRMASINGGPLQNFPNFPGGAPKFTGNAGTTSVSLGLAVAIPATTVAGTYNGSITFVVTTP